MQSFSTIKRVTGRNGGYTHPSGNSRRRHWTPAWNLPYGDTDRTLVHQSDQTMNELLSKDLCHRPKRWQCRWEQRWLPSRPISTPALSSLNKTSHVKLRHFNWVGPNVTNYQSGQRAETRGHVGSAYRPIHLPLKPGFRQRNLISQTFYRDALAAPFVLKSGSKEYTD